MASFFFSSPSASSLSLLKFGSNAMRAKQFQGNNINYFQVQWGKSAATRQMNFVNANCVTSRKPKLCKKNSRSTKRTREQQKRMWMLKEQWICTQTTQTKLTSRLESAAICAKLSEPSSAQFDYPSFKSFSRFSLLSSPQVHKMNICWKKGNINNRGPK